MSSMFVTGLCCGRTGQPRRLRESREFSQTKIANDCRFEVQRAESSLTSDARPVTAKISQPLLLPALSHRRAPTRKPSASVRQYETMKILSPPAHSRHHPVL